MKKILLLGLIVLLSACASSHRKITHTTTYDTVLSLRPMGEVIVRPYYVLASDPNDYYLNSCTLKNNRFYYYRTAYR